MKCIRQYVSCIEYANENVSYACKTKKVLKNNEITSAILISTKYGIHNGLNVWLEMYHCLICDGYCMFDLFSQSRCNTHHILERYITNVDWCNTHHEPLRKLKLYRCLGWQRVLHIWLIFFKIDAIPITNQNKIGIVLLFSLRWILHIWLIFPKWMQYSPQTLIGAISVTNRKYVEIVSPSCHF